MDERLDPERVYKQVLESLKERNITGVEQLAKLTAKEMTRTDEKGNPLVSAVLAGSWYVLVS